MRKTKHFLSISTYSIILLSLIVLSACQESIEPKVTRINEALERIDVPTQTAQFQLVEEESGRVLADGFSLSSITHSQ